MEVSLVVTVFNEEESITPFLESIFNQSKRASEVIIVDGGSTDNTLSVISNFKLQHGKQISNKSQEYPDLKIIKKIGNRSVGRNEAIKRAKSDIIAITDAGCILDKSWVEEITKPFKNINIDVVSGYYKALTSSVFEECLATYTLVMPDKIDSKHFLPSARSMAIRKSVWKEVGGFPQNFPLNEDYVFAHTLKRLKKKFFFTKKAMVYWKPRENILKAFLMFFYFAKGDAQARIFRPKAIFIFIRYIVGFLLLTKSLVFTGLIPLYFIWAIIKNYKYIKKWQAFFLLPLLQVTSDLAVVSATIWGTLKKQ